MLACKSLPLDPERRKSAAWFEHSLFEMFYSRMIRAGCQIMFEFLDSFCRPLRQYLDPAVVEIPNVTSNLMPGCRPLGKIAIADALNFPTDQKLSSNGHQDQFRVWIKEFQVSGPLTRSRTEGPIAKPA